MIAIKIAKYSVLTKFYLEVSGLLNRNSSEYALAAYRPVALPAKC